MDVTTFFRVGGVATLVGSVAMWVPKMLLAQADPGAGNAGVAQTGTMVGASAIIMALGAFVAPFIKAWREEKDAARSHELAMLKQRMRLSDAQRALGELFSWASDVSKANPDLPKPPPVPSLEVESDG